MKVKDLALHIKVLLDNSLWTGSFVTVGIIYETIGTKFIWGLFNKETIGLMRILDIFLHFFYAKFY